VGVVDGIEFRLVVRVHHGLGISREIGAGHRDQVFIEDLHADFFHGKSKSRLRAD